MAVNNPHSVDRAYKFIYKILGIIFHWYLYHQGEKIEFIETEIPDTGQRKDVMVKVDGKTIQITEFMAKALSHDKLIDLFDYHESTRRDPEYDGYYIKTGVFSIAEPTHGKNSVEIDDNVTFHVYTKFAKSKDAWKVLSSLIYKSVTQEELSWEEAVDLLVVPDMYFGKNNGMELPIKQLMRMIIDLMGSVKFPSSDLKEKIFLCEKMVLARFFTGIELKEMIKMLKTASKNPDIARKVEEYGPGFADIYLYGIADAKIDFARNLIAEGYDDEFISSIVDISIEEIRKLRREL